MACLVALIALFFPRIAVVLVVIFSDAIGTACQTVFLPLLAFFFMPLTLLAYTWAWHAGDGNVSGIRLAVVVVAVLMDLGLLGGGGKASRKHLGQARAR